MLRRSVLLFIAVFGLTACPAEPDPTPVVPLGDTWARPFPHSDVHGVARIDPNGRFAQGVFGLLAKAGPMLDSTPVAPLAHLQPVLAGDAVRESGRPIVLFLLDEQVHDGGLGLWLPLSHDQLVEGTQGLDEVRWIDETRLAVARRSSLHEPFRALAQRFATNYGRPVMPPSIEDALSLSWEAIDSAGGTLLVPRREARRNLQATLDHLGLLEEHASLGTFISVDVDRALRRAWEPMRLAANAPLIALSMRSGEQWWRLNRWLERLYRLVEEFARGVDHVVLAESRSGYELCVRTSDDSLADQALRTVLRDAPMDELLGSAAPGQGVAAFALNAPALDALNRDHIQPRLRRRRGRHREDPRAMVLEGQPLAIERMWTSLGMWGEPQWALGLELAPVAEEAPPLDSAFDVEAWRQQMAVHLPSPATEWLLAGTTPTLALDAQGLSPTVVVIDDGTDGGGLATIPDDTPRLFTGIGETAWGVGPTGLVVHSPGTELDDVQRSLDRMVSGGGPWTVIPGLPERAVGVFAVAMPLFQVRAIARVESFGLRITVETAGF